MTTHPTLSTSERFAGRPELDAADVEYFVQRNRARVYAAVMKIFSECAENHDLTRIELARILKTDPGQITRWLSGPSNWTIDTVSRLLLACGAEMDYYPVYLSDRAMRNDQHDLVQKLDVHGSSAIILRQDQKVKSSVPTRTNSSFRIERQEVFIGDE